MHNMYLWHKRMPKTHQYNNYRMTEEKKSQHRRFEGEVTSTKENKTIHVLVRTRKMHPIYKKQYWMSKKYAIHDEKGRAHVGDVVLFEECRPISKTKSWTLIEVTKKA